MVAMQAIDLMISNAEEVERRLTRKLDKMRAETIDYPFMDRWNRVVIDIQKVNERLSTLYELRGKIGL